MAHPMNESNVPTKFATFAMACFWAPDCIFGVEKGVARTVVGYSGGSTPDPQYHKLGDHTECIRVEYDPQVISYDQLLDIFWKNHNPTAKVKRQYTSLIFYNDEEEQKVAQDSLNEQQKVHEQPLVTEILPASTFYDAEDYHQKYRLRQHPWLCQKVNLNSDADFKTSSLAAKLNGYVWGRGHLNDFNEDVKKYGLDEKVSDFVRTLITKQEGQGHAC